MIVRTDNILSLLVVWLICTSARCISISWLSVIVRVDVIIGWNVSCSVVDEYLMLLGGLHVCELW